MCYKAEIMGGGFLPSPLSPDNCFGGGGDSLLLISLFLFCWLIVPPPFLYLHPSPSFAFHRLCIISLRGQCFCAPNWVGGGFTPGELGVDYKAVMIAGMNVAFSHH